MYKKTLKKYTPLLTLPVILAVCVLLFTILSNSNTCVEIWSDTGTWDLRAFDFEKMHVRITGNVEFIPNALLTPDEFEARAEEIQYGKPAQVSEYATSRIRILLPDDHHFMVAGRSIDFSDKIYINGKLAAEIGVPGETRETTIPETASIHLTANPVNGEIILVQQGSNFVHREGGGHDDWRVGYSDVVNAAYSNNVGTMVMGCFLALFLVHIVLYAILPSYRANLYFSLFCLTWFFRSGVTGNKLFTAMLPTLSWYAKFRIEYLALPITGILLVLMIHELFPAVLPKWFRVAAYLLSAAFIGIFLFANTVFMSWAILGCYAYQGLAVAFVLLFFALRLRRPTLPQMVSLAGVVLFLYSGIRDMFYYSNIILPPNASIDLSRISMLCFVFFQMTSMFLGTVQAAEEAKAAEAGLLAEKAALEQVNQLKTEFLGNISHELKAPLTVMSSHAQIVLEHEKEKAPPDAYVIKKMLLLDAEARRMASTVSQLQDITRIEENRMEWHFKATDVAALVQEAIDTFYPVLTRNRNSIQTNLPEGLPCVRCDAEQIRRVLLNLIANAVRFTKDGVITIAARVEDGHVVLSVSDTGNGIAPERLPHLFDRYYSRETTDGVPPTGTGLGLYIAKHAIEAHGGQISIESALDIGTTVAFTLPLAQKEISHGE